MSCIEENTPIKVVGGDKAIKDIQVGDLVYCYDENNNLKIRKVKRVIDNGYKECIKLHWRSQGTHEYGELVCTPDHKILTKDSGWLEAKDTINKDVLSLHSEDNESCNLSKIENYEKVGIKHVYDLEVEEHHNFIANEICVHNCKAPNCQQYPKVITKIIIPRDGHVMMDADYSQIEYRVLTALAGNDGLAKLFADPDSDYHTLMASLMYGVDYAAVTSVMRSAAKSFNFGIPYGMGLGSLAILLTGKNTPQTRDEAAAKMEDYFKNQPKTRKFFDNVKEMAQINGYTKTLFNRYRYYSFTMPDGTVNNGKRAAALRQAGNAVIQGCLDGDTLIETKDFGIVKIKDAVGYSGDIWNGTEWTRGDVLYSGKKQKCIITFRNGQKFICSPIHKFLVGDDAKDINCYVECKDLTNEMSVKCNTKSNLTLFFKSANKLINSNDLEIAVKVESVEITNEWIDMYDVCNTDCGYYVADGIITHNTAADIFKIGVARNFQFIRKNNLLGKLLIINMVHDEQLIEVDVQDLNMQRVLAEVGHNMQLKIEGFPPLYIGAGIGKAWGYAKGKMAEIHPNLLNQLTEEAKQIPLWRTEEDKQKNGYIEPNKVVEYFDSRVLDFRRQKVIDYLTDQTNWNKVMHPAIGGLINLQFNYGRGDDAKAYVGPNGERYSDQEFLELNLSDFIKENNLDVDVKWFRANENMEETKEADDVEYNDGDEDEFDELAELSETADKKTFKIIHDDDTVFGSSIHDIINTFKVCELIPQKMLGIHTKDMYFKRKDLLIETLLNFVCDKEDENALQIVFLTDTNTLNYTGVYVKNVDMDLIEKAYFATSFKEMDFTKGDVKTRSQAK